MTIGEFEVKQYDVVDAIFDSIIEICNDIQGERNAEANSARAVAISTLTNTCKTILEVGKEDAVSGDQGQRRPEDDADEG